MQAIKIGCGGGGDAPQPVQKTETTKQHPPETTDSTRKDFIGESGKRVPASANYIRLILQPDRGVFEYEVKFEPDVDSRSARGKLLGSVITKYAKSKTFDGHILYLPLQCFDREIFSLEHPFDKSPVTMTIIYKRKTRMDECIHLYNVLFNKIMKVLSYKRVGRQFFDSNHPSTIPQHKLEIWPGYVTAVNEFSGGIMLCCDVQHRVLRTQSVLHYMYDVMQAQHGRAKNIIMKDLIGSSVITRYNNASYIVHDITWEIDPTHTFDTVGGPIRYIDYFQNQYNVKIEDKNQPMLVHRTSVRVSGQTEKEERLIMLVPELSYMTGLTDGMRADMRVMKDIAQFTRVTPNQRMNSLRKFINNINQTPEASEILDSWGLKIDGATIDLSMRILDPETILFGNDVKIHGTEQADWTSAAMKNNVMSAIDFQRWLIIYTGQDERLAKDFVETLMRLGPRMGINITPPQRHRIADDRTETYSKVLQEKICGDLQMVLVLAPTNRDDRYMAIKKICCYKYPIPSQVVNSRTLKNPSKLSAITQKIALQMNCKLGGTLWSVKFPFKNWMICGIDVYHSKAAGGKAVCGFISSLNDSMTRWYSTCCFHNNDKELGDHLKVLFIKALNEYQRFKLDYPSHVVVYRDGVGDGQLRACQEIEIRQLQEAIKTLNLDTKLVFIVVQKRINTRLFLKDRDNSLNPPAGSIVDQEVTRRNLFDFFLVAQHVRQGTVTPTHYIVLHNDTVIKPDNIQRLSYKLCHMYYNWTGTVRVPAPCQYAHKLAYLIGQHVRTEPSAKLSTKLFYL